MSRFIKTSSTRHSCPSPRKATAKAKKFKSTRDAASGIFASPKARAGRKSRDPLFDIDSMAVDTGIRDLAQNVHRYLYGIPRDGKK
jgi:hypothetical protein